MIELCQILSTLYLQDLRIQLSCVSLYLQYICKSFKYDIVLPVFIHSIFASVSNTIGLF